MLTHLRINEVSLVDRGAGEQCRVVISKRDDSAGDNFDEWHNEQAAIAARQNEEHLRAEDDREAQKFFRGMSMVGASARAMTRVAEELNKSYITVARGDEADRHDENVSTSEPTGGDSGAVPAHRRPVTFDTTDGTRMKFPNERALAEWLAIQSRIHKSTITEASTMDHKTKLTELAKRAGAVAIAKVIVDDDNAYGISEHELTDLVTECAKREHPQLTDAQAFVKMFTDQSEAGVMLRKAFNVVKAAASADSVTSYPFPRF